VSVFWRVVFDTSTLVSAALRVGSQQAARGQRQVGLFTWRNAAQVLIDGFRHQAGT